MLPRVALIVAQLPSLSSALSCTNAYECVGFDINTSKADSGGSEGYKSNYGPTSSYAGSACRGAFSCGDISLIQTRVNTFYCSATHSCSNASYIEILGSTILGHVNCDGAMSCSYSRIGPHSSTDSLPKRIFGGGDKSLAYSVIEGLDSIEGNGAYSLYKASIDSRNIGAITITLQGYYAGFGAKLLCRTGDICTINCYANACDHFYLRCLGQCIINTASGTTISPIEAATDTEFNEADALSIVPYIFDSETAALNEARCNATSGDLSFDDTNEGNNGPDLIYVDGTDPLCCRGTFACGNINRIEHSDIIFSGFWASQYSNIYSNNGSIFAESRSALLYATVFNAQFVYGTGLDSVRAARVIATGNIVCSGDLSCKETTVISSGTDLNIYLGGRYSGLNLNLYCNDTDVCNIECLGSYACSSISIVCDGICNIQCDVDTGCPEVQTQVPSKDPTKAPQTDVPSKDPTKAPQTEVPSKEPTKAPQTEVPSKEPTKAPLDSTATPSNTPSEDKSPVPIATEDKPTSSSEPTNAPFRSAIVIETTKSESQQTQYEVTDNNATPFTLRLIVLCLVVAVVVTIVTVLSLYLHKKAKKKNDENVANLGRQQSHGQSHDQSHNKGNMIPHQQTSTMDHTHVAGLSESHNNDDLWDGAQKSTTKHTHVAQLSDSHKNDDLWDGTQMKETTTGGCATTGGFINQSIDRTTNTGGGGGNTFGEGQSE